MLLETAPPPPCPAPDGRLFHIRRAVPADAPAVLRYARELFEEPGLGVGYSPGEFQKTVEEEEEFLASHDTPNKLVLVATDGEEVIGLLNFAGGEWARTRHAGTFGITVAKAWRGRGVGSALLGRLLDWARANPVIERVGLEVFATNHAAQRLYRRFGFHLEGRRRAAIRLGDRRIDVLVFGLVLPPKPSTG